MQPRSLGGGRAAGTHAHLLHPASKTLLAGQLVVLRVSKSVTAVATKLQLGSQADAVHCELLPVPDQNDPEFEMYAACWDTALASPVIAEASNTDLLVLAGDQLIQVLPAGSSSEVGWTTGR